MNIAPAVLESPNKNVMSAEEAVIIEPVDAALYGATEIDQAGLAVSQSAAAVHKHPFAPIRLDEEPAHKNIFRHACHLQHCPKGSHHRSKAVRAFIGPPNANWMQGHKRWWVKTAERLESKGGVSSKLHRRGSSSRSSRDGGGDIFGLGGRHGSSELSLSSGSASSVSSSETSNSRGSVSAKASDWSSQPGSSCDNSDSDANSVPWGSRASRTHARVGGSSDIVGAIRVSGMQPEPTFQQNRAKPGYNSIPMPVLSSPKLTENQASTPAPATLHVAESHTTSESHGEDSTHATRRRGSLSTLKAIFQRPGKSWRRHRHDRDRRVPTLQVVPPAASQKSPGTILSVTSTNESLEVTPMSPSRGRAASLSHAPQSSSVPLSPGQAVGRKSLDTGPSKLSSLMRSVVTRRARSVTWQPSHEQDDEEKTKESPKHTGVNNTSPETEVYLRRAVSLEKCAVNPELQILPHKWGLRRTLSAKVRAHYHRYAQLSETAVILSTRAVVRRERVSFTAFAEKYNEATCQRFRQSVQEWSEMWLALTKRGILFYLSSKKRPTVQVLFPPYVSIAPRVSLFSTLDMSLSITYSSRRRAEAFIADAKGKRALDSVASKDSEAVKSNLRVVIIKFPSSQVAFEWYREIGQTLLFERLMYPQCFLGPVPPAAQAPPVSVLVNVPEMGVKVQVKLGRHNAAIPNNVLLGGADDGLLEQQWRCESTTVWHVRRDVVNLLLGDKVIGPQMQQWLDAERDGLLSVGMAWRRFDRLDWVMPCGALGPTGNFILNGINEMVIGPQLLEGTHTLELRVLEHYPDSVVIGGASVPEPLGFEGFVLLKRDKKRRTEIVSYRPMLLTSYDNWLFLIPAPRAARHVDVSANACDAPTRYSGSLTHGSPKSNNGGSNGQIVCYYHANVHTGSKQMSLAKYMLNITEVDQIVPILHDSDSIADDDRHRSESRASADTESMSLRSDYTTGAGSDHGTHRDKVKGKLLGFLRSKKNRQMSCKFKLVTRAGATVVLWAASEQCMHEWVRRLTELRYYWINRLLSDLTLRSQVGVLNYALQGRRSREKDMPDWNDEKAWADRAIWHACLNLGCRDIIISGTLYRKRRRHQGMRRVFCILTHGRLIEYKFPQAPHAPIQSALADQIVRRDVRMSQLFDGARNGGAPVIAAMSDVSSEAAGSIANNSEARLLFTKSRSLSLRQCYVVSRFIDDLNTHDIMCEPWVMTDIGNYSGLRLADRVYADGIVSHELINDCVFTVWRPTFVPAILRTGKASEIRVVPDDALCDASELSSDKYNTGSASESRADSPKVGGVDVKRSVSFSPLVDEPRSALSDSHAMQPLPTQPRDPGHHHHHSHLHRHRHSFDTPRLLVGGQAKPTSVNRTSGDVPRLSGEGYLSSTSNASSNISSGRPQDHGRPGAYRVGNEIHVSVDDRHEGTKRMNAMTMVSSMRHRVGVYKARTSAEMEQWVTAINQEIRRMSLTGEW